MVVAAHIFILNRTELYRPPSLSGVCPIRRASIITKLGNDTLSGHLSFADGRPSIVTLREWPQRVYASNWLRKSWSGLICRLRHKKSGDLMRLNLLAISILAVACSADDWCDMAMFAKVKLASLKTFLELPGGAPSHANAGSAFSISSTFSKSSLR